MRALVPPPFFAVRANDRRKQRTNGVVEALQSFRRHPLHQRRNAFQIARTDAVPVIHCATFRNRTASLGESCGSIRAFVAARLPSRDSAARLSEHVGIDVALQSKAAAFERARRTGALHAHRCGQQGVRQSFSAREAGYRAIRRAPAARARILAMPSPGDAPRTVLPSSPCQSLLGRWPVTMTYCTGPSCRAAMPAAPRR